MFKIFFCLLVFSQFSGRNHALVPSTIVEAESREITPIVSPLSSGTRTSIDHFIEPLDCVTVDSDEKLHENARSDEKLDEKLDQKEEKVDEKASSDEKLEEKVDEKATVNVNEGVLKADHTSIDIYSPSPSFSVINFAIFWEPIYHEDWRNRGYRVPACQHLFHSSYMENWVTGGNNQCPICPGEVPPLLTSVSKNPLKLNWSVTATAIRLLLQDPSFRSNLDGLIQKAVFYFFIFFITISLLVLDIILVPFWILLAIWTLLYHAILVLRRTF